MNANWAFFRGFLSRTDYSVQSKHPALFPTRRWTGSKREGVTQRLNRLWPVLNAANPWRLWSRGYLELKKTVKKRPMLLKGYPHMPFDEFPLKKSEDLVVELERTMPDGAKVEVSPMEESHHSPCMQEMTAIMVHNIMEGRESPDIFTIYQFCPTCHIAVRVL